MHGTRYTCCGGLTERLRSLIGNQVRCNSPVGSSPMSSAIMMRGKLYEHESPLAPLIFSVFKGFRKQAEFNISEKTFQNFKNRGARTHGSVALFAGSLVITVIIGFIH